MIVLLLLASIAAYVIVMIGTGSLGKNVFRTSRDRLWFQILRNGLSVLMMVAVALFLNRGLFSGDIGLFLEKSLIPSGFVMMLAGAMGAAQLLSGFSNVTCFRYGPVSISILVQSSLSMLIATLAGPVFWGESISFPQVLGIVLSLVSMVLLTDTSIDKKAAPVWILWLILAGIGGGVQGPIQKVLTTSAHTSENAQFIIWSFIFAALASVILFFFTGREKKEEGVTYRVKGKVLLLFLSQAALAVFLNINNLTLVEELPTVIFFPAYSIGGLLITTLISIFMFREKMTQRQTAGFIAGLVSLLLISGTLESLFVK